MKCREAKELFGKIDHLSEQDPRRKMAEDHQADCEHCSADQDLGQVKSLAVHEFVDEVTEEQAEQVNRRVMERIYAESPWLVPGENRRSRISPALRRSVSLWIAGFLALFLCSFLVLNLSGRTVRPTETTLQPSGLMPTGIAGSDSASSSFIVHVPEGHIGIMEPIVGNLIPTYPQYWMVLSVLAVALALVSISWVHRVRR